MDDRSHTARGRLPDPHWNSKLILIKLAHTTIWAFFVGCILAIALWLKKEAVGET